MLLQNGGVLAQATVTRYRRLGGLNKRNQFLTLLDAESLRAECLARLSFDEGSFPGSQMVAFSVCVHMAFP